MHRLSVEEFKAGLQPEVELLLGCARLTLPDSLRDRIKSLLACPLDWTKLMTLAQGHGLLPLLYRHFNMLGPEAVPKAIFAQLWARYESNRRRNQAMARALIDVLHTLDEGGIPAIAYKGPALASSVYGDLGLREFSDLDILLRPRDVLCAKRLLQARGDVPEYDLKPPMEAALLRSRLNCHLVVFHGVNHVMVELHWKTDADFPVEPKDDDEWWQNLGSESLEKERIRCFATEELLLILLLHGAKHGWDSLGWLVDVAEIIRQHPDLEWNWLTSKAEQLNCQRKLAVGLFLANHLLDAPLPKKVEDSVDRITEARLLAEEIIRTLFTATPHGRKAFEGLRFNLKLYDRSWQKVTHCTSVLLAPSLVEWSRWPLPRYLHFLYLPLRLVRLLAKYGLT